LLAPLTPGSHPLLRLQREHAVATERLTMFRWSPWHPLPSERQLVHIVASMVDPPDKVSTCQCLQIVD
jgi:hypothetical protein